MLRQVLALSVVGIVIFVNVTRALALACSCASAAHSQRHGQGSQRAAWARGQFRPRARKRAFPSRSLRRLLGTAGHPEEWSSEAPPPTKVTAKFVTAAGGDGPQPERGKGSVQVCRLTVEMVDMATTACAVLSSVLPSSHSRAAPAPRLAWCFPGGGLKTAARRRMQGRRCKPALHKQPHTAYTSSIAPTKLTP